MKKFKGKYRIPSARWAAWDYGSNAAYFVTICINDRAHDFGEIVNGEMARTPLGQAAADCWHAIPDHFPFAVLGGGTEGYRQNYAGLNPSATLRAGPFSKWGSKKGNDARRQTMTFFELIQKRYSVRGYKPAPVEEDKLQQVLEAARLAPTAGNRQRFRLIVVHTEGREEELRRIYDKDWFVQPPLVICACRFPMDPARKLKDYTDVDIGIVVDHLTLAAAELGLGTCWIGAFDPAAAREVLGLPDEVEPVVFTPLGYPADPPRSKQRKPLSELVRYEHW